MAVIDAGAPAIAGAGPVGLLTPGDPSGGAPPGSGTTLEEAEPVARFPAAGAEAPAVPDGRPDALGAHATAATLAAVGQVPCGTGWPDGWSRGMVSPSAAGQRGPEVRDSGGERTCALTGQLGSVPRARDFARSIVCGWGLPHLCDDVMSVVSELVTNALIYGLAGSPAVSNALEMRPAPPGQADGDGSPAPIELRLLLRPSDVVCMVADPGTGTPAVTEPRDLAEGGRGLQVVQSCSDHWGWDPVATGGKVVWAAFRR